MVSVVTRGYNKKLCKSKMYIHAVLYEKQCCFYLDKNTYSCVHLVERGADANVNRDKIIEITSESNEDWMMFTRSLYNKSSADQYLGFFI
jgi:hypothetical protein